MYQVLICLTTQHDWRFVILALTICWLAGAVAISLFHRAKASQGLTRVIWIGLDAVAGGCGIWATHFIAMLAYQPGMGVGYDIPLTLLSLALAVSIAIVGLTVALLNSRPSTAAIGGAIVGLGIAALHYVGMMAVVFPARVVWSPGIVLSSVLLGSLFAALAFVVATRSDDRNHGIGATALLTLAIVSHHFTAMGAMTIIPDPSVAIDKLSISPVALSSLTATVTFAFLGITLVAALLDRRAKGEMRYQKVLLDTALSNMSQGLCMFDANGRILLVNDRYGAMMGRSNVPLRGRLLGDVLRDRKLNGDWDGDPDQFVAEIMAEARAGHAVTRVVTRNGRSIRVVDQPMKGGGWVATFEDITEWQQAQERISHMARHDA